MRQRDDKCKQGPGRPGTLGRVEMAKRSRKANKSQAKTQAYVVVTFAEDMGQAQDYESLLKVNDIPVCIEQQRDQMGNSEIAVMVPEEFLDEAHVIIESQDAYDDFYDLALGDEEDFDYDGELFGDEF